MSTLSEKKYPEPVLLAEDDAKGLLDRMGSATGESRRKLEKLLGKGRNKVYKWVTPGEVNVDLLRYVVMVGSMSEASRLILLRAMGGGVSELDKASFDDDAIRELAEGLAAAEEAGAEDHVMEVFRSLVKPYVERREGEAGGA